MEDWGKYDKKFRYMILDRLRQDCDYYLNRAGKSANVLWAGDEEKQIRNMKAIYDAFKPHEKPEWLTYDDLVNYAHKMGVDILKL